VAKLISPVEPAWSCTATDGGLAVFAGRNDYLIAFMLWSST
jgi:hypothetical protein